MTLDERTLTALAMTIIFAAATGIALTLPRDAGFFPLIVGIPGTILCLWQLALELFRRDRGDKAAEKAKDSDNERSEAEAFLWLGLFAVAIFGFGFVVGGPAIVIAYIRFASRETWFAALFAGVSTLLVIWGIFIQLLGIPLFDGLILEAIF